MIKSQGYKNNTFNIIFVGKPQGKKHTRESGKATELNQLLYVVTTF
jgi:hypothetical protein